MRPHVWTRGTLNIKENYSFDRDIPDAEVMYRNLPFRPLFLCVATFKTTQELTSPADQ